MDILLSFITPFIVAGLCVVASYIVVVCTQTNETLEQIYTFTDGGSSIMVRRAPSNSPHDYEYLNGVRVVFNSKGNVKGTHIKKTDIDKRFNSHAK